ncbi:MAG: hypothetical protein JWL85_37 [Candidatus Saccharibacteria bacterium]|nr:hypothetical protein [Candidatus Saccharibacteria bacterium]
MEVFIFALWFFLPAGAANVAPIILAKAPGLSRFNTPLDFGHTWRGHPVFGKNKTWRGLIGGTLIGSLTALIIYPILFRADNPSPEFWMTAALVGGLLGAGALLGDAIESFFKRQVGVKPGDPWFPFDQIDYVVGGSLLSAMVIRLPWHYYGAIVIVWFGMHLLFSYIGYLLKLKDKPI